MTDDQQSISPTTGSNRRDVMKALGAGTALGVAGVAAGEEHEGDEDVDENDEEHDIEEAAEADHVVELRVEESPRPLRPFEFFYEPTGLQVEPGDEVAFVFETPGHTVTLYHPAVGRGRRGPTDADPFSSPMLGWDPDSLEEGVDEPPEAVHDGDEGDGDLLQLQENETDDEVIDDDEVTDDEADEEEAEVDDDEDDDEEDEAEDPQPDVWTYTFETEGVYDLYCAPHEAFGMAMRVVVGDETDTEFEVDSARDLTSPPEGPVGFAKAVLTDSALEPDEIADEEQIEWADLELNRKRDGEDDHHENDEDDDNENETQ